MYLHWIEHFPLQENAELSEESLDVDDNYGGFWDTNLEPEEGGTEEILEQQNEDIEPPSEQNEENEENDATEYTQSANAIDQEGSFSHFPEEFESIGTPIEEAEHWKQQEEPVSCAIACQRTVLESIISLSLPEKQLAELAEKNGWYDPIRGTSMLHTGALLNLFGVPTKSHFDCDIDDLKEALRLGEKIIVGLDANEIWSPQRDLADYPLELPDSGHAVQVTGIQSNESGETFVILNDPGIADGAAKQIRLDDFLNAWEDFGYFATITSVNA